MSIGIAEAVDGVEVVKVVEEKQRRHLDRLDDLDTLDHCAGRYFGSVGRPASSHACQPPTRGRASGHPAALSSRATRALVASSGQAQYTTSDPRRSSPSSRAVRTASLGGSRTAPRALRASCCQLRSARASMS